MYRLLILMIAACLPISAAAQRNSGKKSKQKIEVPTKTRADLLFDEMLPSTQRLLIVDSVVVDFNKMFSAIPLPADLGRLESYNDFFATASQDGSTVYVNGFGSRCFYSETTGKKRLLYSRDKLGEQWSKAQKLEGLTLRADTLGFPFMAADGITFYFSAKTSDGLGGYDIYMTRYDTDSGQFYEPQNLGLPINSKANDYMYVEDEINQLAWLATDRRQPAGKVCVYTLVPQASRTNYDADEMPADSLRSLARIDRIRDTWGDKAALDEARQRIADSQTARQKQSDGAENEAFVVNDSRTVTSADGFKSAKSPLLFASVKQTRQQIADTETELSSLRTTYHLANKQQKARLKTRILDTESTLDELKATLKKQENELRRTEGAE